MNQKSQKLRNDAKNLIVACKAILTACGDNVPTEAQHVEIAAKRDQAKQMEKAADAIDGVEAELSALDRPFGGRIIDTRETTPDDDPELAIHSAQRIGAKLVDKKTAYKAGMLFALLGHKQMGGKCRVPGDTIRKAVDIFGDINALQIEGSDIPGGNLVFPEFDTTIINLREIFGTFRRNTIVKTMNSDTLSILRRVSGLQMYLVGEAQRITTSSKKWDKIQLIAKKCGALAISSMELNEDSAIDLGTDIMSELAYCAALTEDNAGWNGDGTTGGAVEYLGMTGVRYKLRNLSATISKIYGLTVASGTGYATSYGAVQLADFNNLVANLPAFADTPNCKFYCHRTFYYAVMQRLAMAAGGVTATEVIDGVRRPLFQGYPVEFVQAFPKSAAINQVCCLFGDLGKASKMGSRKGLEFAASQDATVVDGGTTYNLWQNDMIGWRMVERIDINVHDIGTNTDLYANPTIDLPGAGPIVGLITAAS